MPQCRICDRNFSGSDKEILCSSCKRKQQEANRKQDLEARQEINKMRRSDPERAKKMQRDLDSLNRTRTYGNGSNLLPIIIAVVVIGAIVSAVIFFGKSIYVNFAGENGTISVVRDEKSDTFLKKGKPIPEEKISANKAALQSFAVSGESYRMEGEFNYGYFDAGKTELSTQVDMSYNGETDTYKFVLESSGGDNKLDETFRIADGTYYIVKEDGKTYLLSDIDGIKTVTDETSAAYKFLIGYRMETVLYTGVIDRAGSDRLSLWDAEYYRCLYDDAGYMIYSNPKTELRVYNNKPVYYIHKIKNKETAIEYQFFLSFYYDNIPQDNPTVADYR